MNRIISREMTITHNEFFRLLPGAITNQEYNISNNLIEIREGGRSIRIELGDESIRKIASLSLPVTCLTIKFDSFSEKETEEFLKRFDLVYQKGGG